MNDDKYLMSSVYNSLEVLDLLSKYDELGVAEISKILNIGKTSIFRMLYTLEKKGYVHKTSDAKYKLGIKFAHYGSIVLNRNDTLLIIKPFLQKLRDKYNETTHLGILDDNLDVIIMDKEMSNSTIQMTSRVGSKMPFHATSMGKVLVADKLNEEVEDKIRSYSFPKFTDYTITESDDLINLLKQVKEQGYGEDLEETEVGLVCYAVPVKNITGETIASISMSGPAARMQQNKERLINSLKETANEVSKSMGYVGE